MKYIIMNLNYINQKPRFLHTFGRMAWHRPRLTSTAKKNNNFFLILSLLSMSCMLRVTTALMGLPRGFFRDPLMYSATIYWWSRIIQFSYHSDSTFRFFARPSSSLIFFCNLRDLQISKNLKESNGFLENLKSISFIF